jgi:hypothetical protein
MPAIHHVEANHLPRSVVRMAFPVRALTVDLITAFRLGLTERPVMPITPIKTATMLTVCKRAQTTILFIVILPVSMRED